MVVCMRECILLVSSLSLPFCSSSARLLCGGGGEAAEVVCGGSRGRVTAGSEFSLCAPASVLGGLKSSWKYFKFPCTIIFNNFLIVVITVLGLHSLSAVVSIHYNAMPFLSAEGWWRMMA